MIALTVWPALAAPCRAQDNTADIPVLKRYVGRDWIYFASADDGALIFENRPGDASNVWVAAETSPRNRRILAKTDIWTDSRGRLHTVNVLRLQMEFNDLIEEVRVRGPFSTGATTVDETGILDRMTLVIPYMKLSIRAAKISNRLVAEEAAAKRLESADENGAIIKRRFASYLQENVDTAMTLLYRLNQAVVAAPLSTAGEEAPALRPGAANLNGLRGLEVPSANPYNLKLAGAGPGEVRLVPVDERFEPERLNVPFVDPLQMTPAIVADIRGKEAAAEKAVLFAETLCKDLFTPPCE